jgi:hypothetical protein
VRRAGSCLTATYGKLSDFSRRLGCWGHNRWRVHCGKPRSLRQSNYSRARCLQGVQDIGRSLGSRVAQGKKSGSPSQIVIHSKLFEPIYGERAETHSMRIFLLVMDATPLSVQIDSWLHSRSESGSSLQQGQHTGHRRWSCQCGRCCAAAHEVLAMRRSELESTVWTKGSGGNTDQQCVR